MEIHPVLPNNRPNIQAFLRLPFRLYAHTPQWVPPLEPEARQVFDQRRFPFYRYGKALFLLATQGGEAIGRLAVLINDRYNEFNQEKSAFFYLFECENDPKIAQALFSYGREWARSQGMTRMIGPKGFTVFDGLGLLVRGFEYRPAFGIPYNHAYYVDLIESAGFTPLTELVSGYLDEHMEFPPRIHEVAERLMKRRNLRVARYRSRQELMALIPHLKDLYNASLGGTQGNYPLSDEDVKSLASQMLWFADPTLIKVVMKGDQPVGFLLAYPDISAAVQRTAGRVFPLGWITLLRELRRTQWININGAGMVEGYRGLGGTALLFSEMYKTVVESRYRYAEVVQIGVENANMQREMRELGVDFCKTHRVYQCEL